MPGFQTRHIGQPARYNSAMLAQDTWIFGYGSLIWRTGFSFAESRPAFVHGWARRFWQGSTDHRGLPGAPGRVVTLIRAEDAICWGRAFRLHHDQRDEVMAQLDYREKGGYQRLLLPLYFKPDQAVQGTVYLATADNPNYLGSASPAEIAQQVRHAHGPSGPNTEYVMQLHRALTELGAEDPHISEIIAELESPRPA